MSSTLVGVTLLGNTFEQDPNPLWEKIHNVGIGESSEYGYSRITNSNIGALLASVATDANVVCVIYNPTTSVGYVKSGFNLSISTDSALIPGFVTYVLKSKISKFYTPVKASTSSAFVTFSNGEFKLDNSKFVPVGFNAYWMGLTESAVYPTNAEVDEMFNVAIKMKATTIRSHTTGFSSGSTSTIRPKGNTLNSAAWKAIDYVFYRAKQTGIKLICPMTDNYQYYHGGYYNYCNDRNVAETEFWSNSNVIADFKNYIEQWLNHVNSYTGTAIKNAPELFCIELGNELGNIRPANDATTIPTEAWLAEISSFIKTIDTNHLILDGCDEALGGETSNDFAVKTLDVYSGHFYSKDYTRINYGASNAKKVNKPYIIGEYSTLFVQDWFTAIEKIPNMLGTMFWSMYPHVNGLPSGIRISHTDEGTVTLYGDNQTSANTTQIMLITNHFRRMQGLATISSLSF
jgi:hypothetical protein